jgi:phage terminase large subunit-like protein
VAYLSKFLT